MEKQSVSLKGRWCWLAEESKDGWTLWFCHGSKQHDTGFTFKTEADVKAVCAKEKVVFIHLNEK